MHHTHVLSYKQRFMCMYFYQSDIAMLLNFILRLLRRFNFAAPCMMIQNLIHRLFQLRFVLSYLLVVTAATFYFLTSRFRACCIIGESICDIGLTEDCRGVWICGMIRCACIQKVGLSYRS